MTEETNKYITSIKTILGDEVNSILEIQCGDGYDIENCKALQDPNLKYIGVNVVDEIIQDNRQYFREEKNKLFMILDASNEPLPKCDLAICSGMMEYIPIANIWSLIENIRNSGAKYVAFDYYHTKINDIEINSDIKIENDNKKQKIESIKRSINLTMAPFYFPMPEILFPTNDINKSMCLYKISDIALYMEWHDDEISYLRSILLPKLEYKVNNIMETFLKYENGKELIDDVLTNNNTFEWTNLSWNKVYYDEKYKNIVDDDSIFEDYVCLLSLLFKTYNVDRISNNYNISKEKIEDNNIKIWMTVLARDYILYRYNKLTF